MSIELGYFQASIPGVSLEKENRKVLDNDWKKFADKHNVEIPVPKKSRQYYKGSRHRKNDNSEITVLYVSTFDISVNEYKKSHGNSRPIWAKLYRERGIPAKAYATGKVTHDEFIKDNLSWVEKEEFEFKNGKKITVLRYGDCGGFCKRLITIWNDDAENLRVRQEDKISKNKWQASSIMQFPRNEVEKLMMPLVAHS